LRWSRSIASFFARMITVTRLPLESKMQLM